MNTYEQAPPAQAKADLTSVLYDSTVTHDVSEEFTLPDYVPEVRKVLFTRAQILPESKYISDFQGGANLDFGGTVTYSVIYTDDEGKLCSTPLSSSYEASTTLKATPSNVFIDTFPDNVTTRVNAPRKLTIKSRLKSRVLALEDKVYEERIAQKSSADELFIERKHQNVKTVCVSASSLSNVKMSDKFDIGAKRSLRPVLCDAFAYVKDVTASNDSVAVRAEACVKCLCESEGELFCATRLLPIYEQIEAEGCCVNDLARAHVRCVSLSISSEENEGDCQLFFDLTCDMECEVYRNEENSLTSDIYSTKNEMDTEYKCIDIYSLAHVSGAQMTVNESVKRKSKDASQIVSVLAEAVYEKFEIKGHKASVFGRLCTNIIAASAPEGASSEYIYESYELPIKYDCVLDAECENPLIRASFSTSDVSAKYIDDKLHINAEIYPSVCIIDKKSTKILDSATLKKDKEFTRDASQVRVYFPKENDTLWSIAKKYHITSKQLLEQNMLSDEDLSEVKCLII